MVARALADRGYADELRDACMNVAVELGGWTNEEKIDRWRLQTNTQGGERLSSDRRKK